MIMVRYRTGTDNADTCSWEESEQFGIGSEEFFLKFRLTKVSIFTYLSTYLNILDTSKIACIR